MSNTPRATPGEGATTPVLCPVCGWEVIGDPISIANRRHRGCAVPAPAVEAEEGQQPKLPDPRVAARAAVEKVCADRYDGPGRCWRPTFIAALLRELAPILHEDMRPRLTRTADSLLETADYELEEAWPK